MGNGDMYRHCCHSPLDCGHHYGGAALAPHLSLAPLRHEAHCGAWSHVDGQGPPKAAHA